MMGENMMGKDMMDEDMADGRVVDEKSQVHGLVKVFRDEDIQAARMQGRLLSIDIELTKMCNLRCVYCYADGGNAEDGELDVSEICQVIDEAKELGARTVNFTGGEPLMHRGFFTLAEHAKNTGLDILLYTNGTLITRDVADRMAKLDIFPCVKLDSISPDVQDTLAGVNGTFKRIMEGMDNLKEAGYRTFNINTVICRPNLSTLPGLLTWARGRNIQPSFLRLGPKGRAKNKDSELAVDAIELRQLFEELSRIDKTFGIDWMPATPFCGRGCHKHYISCFVSSKGFVQPCTGVDVHAGNIREDRLEKMLSSKVFKIARNLEKHLKGACGTCEHKSKCYGCRGLAYYLSGDFTAADPLCWNNPEAVSTTTQHKNAGTHTGTQTTRMRYIDLGYISLPRLHAVEEAVARIGQPTLMLWTARPATVNVGYFQSVEQEVDVAEAKKLGLTITRRPSGGGAVLFDERELYYSIVARWDSGILPKGAAPCFRKVAQGLINALEGFGLSGTFAGKNDILVNGKKISGNAQTNKWMAKIQHGTFLLDFDISTAARVLKIRKEKVVDKGIYATSTREMIEERVTTLTELLGKKVGREEVKEELKRGFAKAFGVEFVDSDLTPEEMRLASELTARYDDPAWIYRR